LPALLEAGKTQLPIDPLRAPPTFRVLSGAMLWAGCVLTTIATEHVFEVRTYAIFSINAGFWLIGMMLMGAVVGAWKKK
jgi:Protein of unknown function (DUF1761)